MKNNYKKIIYRFFAVFVLIVIFLSGCKNNQTERTELPSTSETILESQDIVVPDWVTVNLDKFADYPSIIEEYRRFAEYAAEFEYNGEPEGGLWYNWGGLGEVIAVNINDSNITKNEFGYAIKDLNGNGNNELILILKDYTIMAIFSMADGNPKLLDYFWPRHRCAIYDTGMLYTLSSGGAVFWECTIWQISQDGNELLAIEKYGSEDGLYKILDGEKQYISESEMDNFHEKFPILHDITAREITKNSGLEFISLFG